MAWILDDVSNTHTIPLYVIIPAKAEVVYFKIGDIVVEQNGATIGTPVTQAYGVSVPIQLNLKNTGGSPAKMRFELKNAVTNTIISSGNTQISQPGDVSGFGFNIQMPNSDLSLKVESYHEV